MNPIVLICFTFVMQSPAIDPAALKKEQEAAWADLADKDQMVGARAFLKFSNRPVETVAFLKTVLKPLKIEKETVKKLIADLASDDEKVWKPAFETFEYQDPRLAYSLEECFELSKAGPGRQRLAAVVRDESADEHKGETIKLTKHSYGHFTFQSKGVTRSVEHRIRDLAGNRYDWNKRYWSRMEMAIVLLEHIGTKDAIDILKSLATGHPEVVPTVAAKESLKLLKAE